jgi:hypothetical protein
MSALKASKKTAADRHARSRCAPGLSPEFAVGPGLLRHYLVLLVNETYNTAVVAPPVFHVI